MTDPRDEDALSWGGDDDPTLDVGTRREEAAPASAAASLPPGYHAVGKGAGDVPAAPTGDVESVTGKDDEPAQLGNVALVSLGLLGGVYLLYTIGWVIGGLRLQVAVPAMNLIPAAYVPAFWLALLAPAIWFGATLLLTRRAAAWQRWAWLIAGALLLVPWPFIMIGAIGQ